MDSNAQTAISEAISLITIAAILVGVGCYFAEINNVSILAPALFLVAGQVYHLFPALNDLPLAQMPMLTGAGATGIAFFIITIPLAYWLAAAFSRQGIRSLERSTTLLRKRRERVRRTRREADRFLLR
jgi:hypothetical protein